MRVLLVALLAAISYAQTDLVLTHEFYQPINATEEVFYVAEESSKKSTFKKPLTWVILALILILATIFGAIAATYCLKYYNSSVKKIPSEPHMSHCSSTRSESLTFEKNKSSTHSRPGRESVRRRYNDDGNCGSRKSVRESVFDPSRKSGVFSGSASSRRSARFKAPSEERSRSRYGGGRHFIPMEKNSSKQNVLDSPKGRGFFSPMEKNSSNTNILDSPKNQSQSPKNNNQPLLYE